MTEVGCLAHARRKFNDLWVNHQSPLAEEALQLFGALYDVERQARELNAEQRQRIRQLQSRPIADKLREWLLLHRQKATDGTAIAKAIDYSLGRWEALTRFIDDGALPIDDDEPTEQDYDRYEVTSGGWYGTTTEVSEDYRQNQRLTAHTNAQRDEVVTGLRASIARIEQQNRTLKAQNAPAEEVAKNDALIAQRRRQLATALAPVETPTRAIGSREAADLDKALKTEISDLKRDMTTLFARYQALIQEVSAVNAARAGLAAADRPLSEERPWHASRFRPDRARTCDRRVY